MYIGQLEMSASGNGEGVKRKGVTTVRGQLELRKTGEMRYDEVAAGLCVLC